MSRIARQLCDEIEAPLRGKERQPITRKYDNKCNRSYLIDKQKALSRTEPKSRSVSRIKSKSEEVASADKSFVDTGVNTIARGTSIVARNFEKCVCRTPQKCHSNRRIAKEVQTYDLKLLTFSDKASLNCVKTVTCGTQSFNCTNPQHYHNSENHDVTETDLKEIDNSQTDYQSQTDKTLTEYLAQIAIMQECIRKENMKYAILQQLELRKLTRKKTSDSEPRDNLYNQVRSPNNRFPYIKYMGARRWCISQNPTIGPDF